MSVTIKNPVLNSPYHEPTRHWVFDDDGITDQIANVRRSSSYFIPIPPPKKKGAAPQATLAGATEWTEDRLEENRFINQVRGLVKAWRDAGYVGITNVTRDLLTYWRNPDRERPLFFCQIEALETAIYLTEVAPRTALSWLAKDIKRANDDHNPGLNRLAVKMATGSGKTVVMAMLIAWQSLNKLANPQDKQFSDSFLIVAPGITIRDRLRVLLPNDPGNYYIERDILPPDLLQRLHEATIVVTNFHSFLRRDNLQSTALTKKILAGPAGDLDRFRETQGEMVRRVCREFGSKRNIVVLNDEAHHCYSPRSTSEDERKVGADEREEAVRNTNDAKVWVSGLQAIREKMGVRAIYDLSATPFFLRGSGYQEGTLFPWVVSDFSLIDAIESGIVKIPRVPTSDDQLTSDSPTYRDLWPKVRDELPKKGRSSGDMEGIEPKLPVELEGALRSLYGNYEKVHREWAHGGTGPPPVFIVVCSNTRVSKLVYDFIAGWEKPVGKHGEKIVVPGSLLLFSNEKDGRWSPRPTTLLIDSVQLESGAAMSDDFKKVAATEISEFKDEYRRRFPGRDADDLTDEDLLREVMNTVGKQGKLGEDVKCVVSVSMLTEGWDATTVTHILGIRAFGTQLLCEQVVGRALRRRSYETNDDGMFEPEYAEVYGVPFSFIPTSGVGAPSTPKPVNRVRALEERSKHKISFPRVVGYRYDLPKDHLSARFTESSTIVLSTEQVPSTVEVDPIVGLPDVHTLEALREQREATVNFNLARRTLSYLVEDGDDQPWLFPQLLSICQDWMRQYLVCKDNTFPQLLLLTANLHRAAETIYKAIVRGTTGEKRLLPLLRAYEPFGTTQDVAFDTTKPVISTTKSHLNYVVADTQTWEQKMTEVLESITEVESYVKNQGLGFMIPYTFEGERANYVPDFIVVVRDREPDSLNLIVEVTGESKRLKKAKVETAESLWVPAINNDGRFGRWAFIEIKDPWDAENLIRAAIPGLSRAGA